MSIVDRFFMIKNRPTEKLIINLQSSI